MKLIITTFIAILLIFKFGNIAQIHKNAFVVMDENSCHEKVNKASGCSIFGDYSTSLMGDAVTIVTAKGEELIINRNNVLSVGMTGQTEYKWGIILMFLGVISGALFAVWFQFNARAKRKLN